MLNYLRYVKQYVTNIITAKKAYNNEWNLRIKDVTSCLDNSYIPRVPKAGRIFNNVQIMHNGLKIIKNSYYGVGITRMLKLNMGVHEPQEERIFQEVLKSITRDEPVIIELGAYWSFYSMWFLSRHSNGQAYLIEPDLDNLEMGKRNFSLNGLHGTFINAFIDEKSNLNSAPPIINIEFLISNYQLKIIDILHSDIQGFEYKMLLGIPTYFLENIKYFFISTHSNEVHQKCIDFLIDNNFDIITNLNLDETFSVDGLIVAENYKITGQTWPTIGKKPPKKVG